MTPPPLSKQLTEFMIRMSNYNDCVLWNMYTHSLIAEAVQLNRRWNYDKDK